MASRIKIGMVNYSINMLDHWVALDLGLYREEGLDVELVGSQPTREAVRTSPARSPSVPLPQGSWTRP